MKIRKLILATIIALSFGTYLKAQGDADECTRFKAIAGNAYQVKDFEKVTSFYIKALDECGTLEMIFYNPFLYSIQKSIDNAADETVKAAYLDTLIYIYEVAQEQHGMQIEWQNRLAYNYLKLGTPGAMKKADKAYEIGIHHEKEKVNKGYLQQYYLNLYNLWVQEKDEKVKAAYKKRVITEFFKLSDYVNKGDMGVDILEFLSTYLNNVVTDCESILPEINEFMKDLPQEIEAKKTTVNNFMKLLEDQKCTNSAEYVMLVDTIIAIDPSVGAVLAKAKLQMSQGKQSDALRTFDKALAMTKDADERSDIEYEIAKIHFNSKNFKTAHNAGIAVSGKNSGKGYEIAARSVRALMNDCGVSTFDRKANNYYAVELAQKSGNTALVNQLKSECPTSSDIFNAVKTVGESVTLPCWNKTYTIEVY